VEAIVVRTTAEAEQFVREHWAHIRTWVRDLDSYGTDQFNIGVFLSEESANCRMDYMRRWQEDDTLQGIATAWAAAAEFTEQRMEEIRQVAGEVRLLEEQVRHEYAEAALSPPDGAQQCYIVRALRFDRILRSKTAELKSLRKDMRHDPY
jgi:hypothetical protein